MRVLRALFCTSLFFVPLSVSAQESFDAEPTVAMNDTGKGELSVTLSRADAIGSVPKGATRIELGSLNLSASCDADSRVESVTLRHTGLGNIGDIAGVYIVDSGRRLSRAQHFDRNGSVKLSLRSAVIPRCSAERWKILVDISPDAEVAGEHSLTIQHASHVTSSAQKITLQLQDPTEKVVTVNHKAGTITVNFLPVLSRPNYGRTQTVARVQFTADTRNAHLLKKITFTNDETVRDMDLVHLRLEKYTGEPVTTTAARMKGKTVMLNFEPSYILERGQTLVFLLKAEVRSSGQRKIKFILEEEADLEATLYQGR